MSAVDPRLTLSLCLIVRDEAPRLRACVTSFGDVFDELVIVDTGSVDGTEAVARDLLRGRAGRLERFAWVDDFAAARNFACGLCRAPWILMVDADERLAPGVPPRALLDLVRQAPPEVKNLLLVDLTLRDGAVVLSHPVNRLFRNDPTVRWVGRIHETLTVSDPEQRLTSLTLVHDNEAKREQGRLPAARSRMYEDGLRRDVAAQPDNPRHLFYLGNTLAERDEHAAAVEAFDRYLAHARAGQAWVEERWQALVNAAWCRRRLGDHDGARRALHDAVALSPLRNEAYQALGDLALEQGRLDEARHWFQVACGMPQPERSLFLDVSSYRGAPWWRLGTALLRLGDLGAAALATERARQWAPHDPEVAERAAQLRFALADQEPPPLVVIPSRTPALVEGCLEALRATEGDVYHEVLVVCDGGTGPFEPLLARFPRLRLLAAPRPFVFARSANLGLAAAEGDVVLLNDDARPRTPGWLDALRAAARDAPVGPVGPVSPVLTTTDNPTQRAPAAGDERPWVAAERVTFVCVYLARDLVRAVGPLDEGFVWYGGEDDDYCLRSALAGRPARVARGAVVAHDAPSSSFGRAAHGRRMRQAHHHLRLKHGRAPAPRDVVALLPREAIGPALPGVARLLAATPEDCRVIVVAAPGDDDALAERLRDLDDPRLVVRLLPGDPDPVAALDEVARASRAEVLVAWTPGLLVPDGWLAALDRAAREPAVGVVGLFAREHAPPRVEPVRVGATALLPCAPAALARAGAFAVARQRLVDLGPLPAPGGAGWAALAERLALRGLVSGAPWPSL